MPMTQAINVLLTDDHYIVRQGLRVTLSEFPFIRIVGEAANGLEAIEKVKALTPDVVLMDINMPGMNGLEATRQIRKNFPKTKIIVLTVEDSNHDIDLVLRAGADGYVLKDTLPDELANAIRSVHNGGAVLSPVVARHVVEQFAETPETPANSAPTVTPRDRQVIQLVTDGKTNKEIAQMLNLSVRSVETYRLRLMRRFNVSNAAELTRYALEHHLLG
jgi:DNA-binding NarL/FixJ family response regulator